MPTEVSTIRTGTGFPCVRPDTTRNDAIPKGAFEGMIAFTWVLLAYSGSAFTVVLPCVMVMETPPSVVSSGKTLTGTGEGGPKRGPKMLKMDPRALPPPGTPWGTKLAAFRAPRLYTRGGCAQTDATNKTIRTKSARMKPPDQRSLFAGLKTIRAPNRAGR